MSAKLHNEGSQSGVRGYPVNVAILTAGEAWRRLFTSFRRATYFSGAVTAAILIDTRVKRTLYVYTVKSIIRMFTVVEWHSS